MTIDEPPTILINNIKMKFSKSDRHLHQPDYNPPPNVYQPQHNFGSNKILTGSLAPPTFFTRNTFGYVPRFDKNDETSDNPGPGTY